MRTYYRTSITSGSNVARAREITIGNLPVNVSSNTTANLTANADLDVVSGSYAFASSFLGGQASLGLMTRMLMSHLP